MQQTEAVGILAVPLALLVALSHAEGASAPAGLNGKSVRLSWTDQRVERRENGSEFSVTQTSTIKIYVSDKGRVFSQFDRSTGGSNARQDLDISDSSRSVLNFHAEGNKLVADQASSGGARRVTISFDQGFGSCSAEVINGASGKRAKHLNLSKTAWVELISIKVTSTSCSVSSGNAFGN